MEEELPKRIALLGTGWLGMPLLATMAGRGHELRGSYRRAEAAREIEAHGGQAYRLDLPETAELLDRFLMGVDALVVSLPPGGRRLGPRATENYLNALAPLSGRLANIHTVYTSSTGVYGRAATGRVDEESPLAPDTDSSQAVVAAEEWLRAHAPRLTILRLAGLFGPGRDPADFFRGRDTLPRADAPVNMVHRDDAVAAVAFVLHRQITGTFNVCAASHPTKREFYGAVLAHRDRTLAYQGGGADGKVVDATRLRSLGWEAHTKLV